MKQIERAGSAQRRICALRGDRNQCAGCGEYFNSSAAFDKHRTGSFGFPAGDGTYAMHTRRCRTVAEMESVGMAKNAAGYWITAHKPMNYAVEGRDKAQWVATTRAQEGV